MPKSAVQVLRGSGDARCRAKRARPRARPLLLGADAAMDSASGRRRARGLLARRGPRCRRSAGRLRPARRRARLPRARSGGDGFLPPGPPAWTRALCIAVKLSSPAAAHACRRGGDSVGRGRPRRRSRDVLPRPSRRRVQHALVHHGRLGRLLRGPPLGTGRGRSSCVRNGGSALAYHHGAGRRGDPGGLGSRPSPGARAPHARFIGQMPSVLQGLEPYGKGRRACSLDARAAAQGRAVILPLLVHSWITRSELLGNFQSRRLGGHQQRSAYTPSRSTGAGRAPKLAVEHTQAVGPSAGCDLGRLSSQGGGGGADDAPSLDSSRRCSRLQACAAEAAACSPAFGRNSMFSSALLFQSAFRSLKLFLLRGPEGRRCADYYAGPTWRGSAPSTALQRARLALPGLQPPRAAARLLALPLVGRGALLRPPGARLGGRPSWRGCVAGALRRGDGVLTPLAAGRLFRCSGGCSHLHLLAGRLFRCSGVSKRRPPRGVRVLCERRRRRQRCGELRARRRRGASGGHHRSQEVSFASLSEDTGGGGDKGQARPSRPPGLRRSLAVPCSGARRLWDEPSPRSFSPTEGRRRSRRARLGLRRCC